MKFTESHEWISIDGEVGTVGITSHAQKELGEVVYVELPQIGKHVQAAQEAAVLESTKAASDVYSPVSGEIVAINEAILHAYELINRSPEKEGWLFKIRLHNFGEYEGLMGLEEYQQLLS